MLTNPKPGSLAQVWYRQGVRQHMPLHGKVGEVVAVGQRRPRNHGVSIEGKVYVVPCGNLRRPESTGRGSSQTGKRRSHEPDSD
ncbi:MAG TPA: hypothetical protein VMY35_11200 [Phycisphaerae bacterium]|nr:hypothetical protein [Phycisphaerae bacterium]